MRIRLLPAFICVTMASAPGPDIEAVWNRAGLKMLIAAEDTQPALHIRLPGLPDTDRSIRVLFPEHVTARRHDAEPEHLYMFRPGKQSDQPSWRRLEHALEYERDFAGQVHLRARASLEDDGVRFTYEFTNRSKAAYDMIYAVTDPRLTGIFHDVRLERTYVHHHDGFDLLASETPDRRSMPLDRWLPARYLVSFTWPVPAQLVERRADGITYYNKSRAVDQPMLATLSTDKKWVIASFTRTVGNVWSNPELTCQHVDPEIPLPPDQSAAAEVKMLVFQGSLDQALEKVVAQRRTLR
ncbi:MAG TPA: hypothetical protein VKR61_24035 [Bryobacteraceae bacterium]|nr:hypothetical protein [Bryobacteraceae bacterium]